MCRLRLLLAASVSSLIFTQTAFAAAYQLYELGTPIIGTAGVGQAAVAADASTAYFNPAGMALLPTSQFMLGSQIIVPMTRFSRNSSTTISGDNGGSAGTLAPGVAMYYVHNYSPRLKMGVSLTTPGAGALSYNDGWAGRYLTQNVLFYTFNLNPALSYQLNQWAALGAGVSLEYANLQQTVALPISGEPDGQINLKTANFAPGANVGLLLTPYQATRIGMAYRSRISHDLHGNITFLNISDQPNVTTRMVMAQNVIVSLTQELTNRFTLLGEVGWAKWSEMQSLFLKIGPYSPTTVLDWNDTYRVGLGGQYQYTQALLLQAGASFDSSPTSSSHRVPSLPMDRQIRIGAGLTYAFMSAVKLGVSYEYINFGNANINNTSSVGVLAGSYSQNYANVVQVSLNVNT